MASKNGKTRSGSNRRKWPRRKPSTIPILKGVELCQDTAVCIVNISPGGLLLETEARLRPDWKIVLKVLTTEGTAQIDGIILRSSIHSLKGPPRYRTAIEFNKPLDILVNFEAEAINEVYDLEEPTDGDPQSQGPHQGTGPNADTLTPILTVVASDANGVRLVKKFSLYHK